MVKCLLTSR
ncbi:hypothetical protein D030_0642A, partial [Vibrio parahaemolyticus AQ3810]